MESGRYIKIKNKGEDMKQKRKGKEKKEKIDNELKNYNQRPILICKGILLFYLFLTKFSFSFLSLYVQQIFLHNIVL